MSRVLPVLFNTEMAQALLDGRKTATRRLIKQQPDEKHTYPLGYVNDSTERKNIGCYGFGIDEFGGSIHYAKPPYQPGDILYVRETWSELSFGYVYKADGENIDHLGNVIRWHPSIHMPKEAARIWLKVKDVRVERLQEITEIQTEEEGLNLTPPCSHQVSEDSYCDLDGPCASKIKYCDMSAGEYFGKVLWNSTIKKSDLDRYGWDANPWVWVIEFERCEKPEIL